MITLLKHPQEVIRYGWEFAGNLQAGETVSSVISLTVTRADGLPSDLVSSGLAASGTQAQAILSGGTEGVTYTLEVKVLTSSGNNRVGQGRLLVHGTVS